MWSVTAAALWLPLWLPFPWTFYTPPCLSVWLSRGQVLMYASEVGHLAVTVGQPCCCIGLHRSLLERARALDTSRQINKTALLSLNPTLGSFYEPGSLWQHRPVPGSGGCWAVWRKWIFYWCWTTAWDTAAALSDSWQNLSAIHALCSTKAWWRKVSSWESRKVIWS